MKREHEIEPHCVYCANLDDNLNCVVDICFFVLKEATFLSKVKAGEK
jgi:hypothetical protein